MSLVAFLLSLGVSCRITRFITKDVLAARFRSWVAGRFGDDSNPAYLVSCGWCTSVWVAASVTPVACWIGDTLWFQVGAIVLTLSYLTGLASSWLD
jgi:hypothetical protein